MKGPAEPSLEAASALLNLVRAVLDSEIEPTADELAVFLRPVTDALEDVLSVAARAAPSSRPGCDVRR